MSGPCTKRPEVDLRAGDIWVFVGGAYQIMDVASAKALRDKLDAAIAAADALGEAK